MAKFPEWKIPHDLEERLESDEDGTWESDRWSPFHLTVMKGTSYEERDIPLAWQIEFEPGEPALESANERIEEAGIEPDGYGWAGVLSSAVAERHPEIAGELHDDSEIATCVVWVESEAACRLVLQIAWSLIHSN